MTTPPGRSGRTPRSNGARALDVTYALDLEGKALISAPPGQPGWGNLDVTPGVEFVAKKWIDVLAEGVLGRTVQTDDLRTTETTVRGGFRFHLFSRQERLLFNEQLPKRRVVLRDLIRWEWRRFSYSDNEPTSSSGRLRNRLEFLYPLNHPNLGADGTYSLIADWEWFVPFSDQHERFADKRRYRGGISYRRNRKWTLAVLYMRTNSRNTIDEPFSTEREHPQRAIQACLVRRPDRPHKGSRASFLASADSSTISAPDPIVRSPRLFSGNLTQIGRNARLGGP